MSAQPDLASIRERVRKATGPDRELDAAIEVALDAKQRGCRLIPDGGGLIWVGDGRERSFFADDLTASIDAALALVEKVLPGWMWAVVSHRHEQPRPWASLTKLGGQQRTLSDGCASPSLAILDALLSAIIERQPA